MTRRITVYRNGVIESESAQAPEQVQVIACAYPYQYLQSSPRGVVRYSQMLEMRRDLPGAGTVSFFGRNDASLRVEAEGLKAIDHQVWLDGGEIGWEVGIDAQDKKSTEDTVDRMTRMISDTYIAGGMHVTTWKGHGGRATLWYRIGNFGANALDAGTGLVRTPGTGLAARAPIVKAPEPTVSVEFEKTEITVNRLYPNEINGWELRPITLAKRNPQPAYFPAELVNRSEKQANISLSLDDADWIHTAKVLSNREMLKHRRFGSLRIPFFHDEAELKPGGAPVAVTVPAGTSVPVEVLIRPKSGTLGLLKCRLRWGDGESTDLEVLVRPTTLFMPMFAPVNDVGREFANVGGVAGAPFIYGARFWGGYTPDLIQWYEAAHRDVERHGFWTFEPLTMRGLVDKHGEEVAAGGEGVDLFAWAEGVLDALRDPRFVDYRVRVYMHDEIHGSVGASGHYIVPLSWLIGADRLIVMNSPTAAWPSFQEGAIDKPFQYHIKLPNDVAELFYYCGQDARLQKYALMVVEPRRELFEQWRADPGFMANAGTKDPRQIVCFSISTQLHVTKYTSIRRQIWWLRHHGFDAFNSWATCGHYSPYAGRIMNWMLMTVGPVEPPHKRGYLLTDRALGWRDMREDMELVTLVRLLSEQINDKALQRKLDGLAAQALEASQRDDFDEARHYYVMALELLGPDLMYLAPRDLYRGPVRAEPLPDLFADDAGFRDAQKIPETTVPLIKEARNRPKPTVDGILDNNAYLEEGVTLELREYMQGSKPKAATAVYVARDKEHLYLLFNCNEPKMAQLRTIRTERDSPVWADDCVEVFVDRAGDGKKCMHFVISAAGVRYESRTDLGAGWNPDYTVAALREPEAGFWTVELRIPFDILGGPPKPGETWRMNFCRERYADVPNCERGAWSVTFGAFLNPERFGKVQFVK